MYQLDPNAWLELLLQERATEVPPVRNNQSMLTSLSRHRIQAAAKVLASGGGQGSRRVEGRTRAGWTGKKVIENIQDPSENFLTSKDK